MDPFYLKLLASFVVGGAYIAFVIRLSERFGSALGGVLAGMPSTVLVSLLFIALTQNAEVMRAAIPIIPAGLGVSAVFLAVYVRLPWRSRLSAWICALPIWLMGTAMFVFGGVGLTETAISALVLVVLAAYLLYSVPHRALPISKSSAAEFLFRATLGGGIVALAVFLARHLGPAWGGVAASFPAASCAAIWLLNRKHGPEFTASFVKTVPWGIAGNIAFLIFLYAALPDLGLWQATAAALILSFSLSFLFFKTLTSASR